MTHVVDDAVDQIRQIVIDFAARHPDRVDELVARLEAMLIEAKAADNFKGADRPFVPAKPLPTNTKVTGIPNR